jgi:hypothetical protein
VKVHSVHERRLAASPERVVALFEDLARLWPPPVPRSEDGRLRIGPMLWERVEDAGAPAFRIVEPAELPARHWFEVVPGGDGETILRHTVAGEAVGDFEPVWRDLVGPMHDVYIEALFDRAEEALA